MDIIPYGRQNITDDDIKAVVDVLKSELLTQGPQILEFETAFAKYIGVDYALAVSNGTAALHLCALAMGIKEGDKVITTPLTFAATANSIRYVGGEVVFCDIDPTTLLIDLNRLEEILANAPVGTYKGIIPVDFAGRAVDLDILRKIANNYDMWIIEDACHAPGGFFEDENGRRHKCGNGEFADLAIFSFHPVKHIAAGEGGMITTNNKFLYDKLKNLRTHGIQQNPSQRIYNHGLWYYEMQELGYNYRLTDFQAALGSSQLKRAEQGLKRRKEIAQIYEKAFSGKPYLKSQVGFVEGHAYHLYVIEVEQRKALYEYLREKNIFAQIHYIPVHLMPYYRQFGWKEGDLPFVEEYYENCISLPMFPTLTNKQVEYVVNCINSFYE